MILWRESGERLGLEMVEGSTTISGLAAPQSSPAERNRRAIGAGLVAILILFYFWRIFLIGMDIRAGLWSGPNMREDIDDAMTKSDMILSTSRQLANLPQDATPTFLQVVRGWMQFYDQMDIGVENHEVKLDYPPMRSLVLVLWERHVEENFPGFTISRTIQSPGMSPLSIGCSW